MLFDGVVEEEKPELNLQGRLASKARGRGLWKSIGKAENLASTSLRVLTAVSSSAHTRCTSLSNGIETDLPSCTRYGLFLSPNRWLNSQFE
jgi:hypothetical protein